MPQFSGWLEPYLPIMILGFCLLIIFGPAGEMAISFTPAEVDFLFPAPFHRRELLIYKLAKLFIGSVFVALFFSMSVLALSQLVARGVRRHFSDAGVHATARLDRGDWPARSWPNMLIPRTRRLILLGLGALVLGRPGPDALADAGSEHLRARLELPEHLDRDGSSWRHSKYSAMRSWPRRFFPTWFAGAGGGRRSTWACWFWSSSSTPIISKGPRRSARSSTNACSARDKGGGVALADLESRGQAAHPRLPGWEAPGRWRGGNCCWPCARRGWSS